MLLVDPQTFRKVGKRESPIIFIALYVKYVLIRFVRKIRKYYSNNKSVHALFFIDPFRILSINLV